MARVQETQSSRAKEKNEDGLYLTRTNQHTPMKKLIDEEEIERYTRTDWVAVGMAAIIGLAIALIIFDFTFTIVDLLVTATILYVLYRK